MAGIRFFKFFKEYFMARSSLYDAQAVADPAQVWNFDLFLPTIPGSSSTTALTWKCQTTGLPGFSIDRVTVPLHGVELVYMGRKVYEHTFTTTFLESADWSTRAQFYAWSEAGRSWINNTGSFASTYKVNGQIVVYNDLPQVSDTINVIGMWPAVVADVDLNGGESAAVSLSITWSYDYVQDT
jgi:hypothetical protein